MFGPQLTKEKVLENKPNTMGFFNIEKNIKFKEHMQGVQSDQDLAFKPKCYGKEDVTK